MNGSRKCGIYTQWNFTQPQRKGSFICEEPDGLSQHFPLWERSDQL
jgi:hypothetical protein